MKHQRLISILTSTLALCALVMLTGCGSRDLAWENRDAAAAEANSDGINKRLVLFAPMPLAHLKLNTLKPKSTLLVISPKN